MKDDVCEGTLFSGWLPCYLISKISTKMPTSVTIMIEMWNHCILLPPLQYQMGACKHDLHWLCWDVMTMSLLTAMYIHYDVYKTTVHVLRIS